MKERITNEEALNAAKVLKKYCGEMGTKCNGCIFRYKPEENDLPDEHWGYNDVDWRCKLDDNLCPDYWQIGD